MWQEENSEQPWRDPIVEEIHKIRQEQAARFGNDIRALIEDARKRQQEGGRQVVSFASSRRPSADQPGG